MDQEEFEAIVAQLRGLNSSGTLNTTDLSVLQNAILGVLTNTYRPPQVGKTTDELIMDYAPDLFAVANTGDALRKDIAARVMRNEDVLSIKAKVRLQLETMPATDGAPLNEEYLELVDTYKNQWQEFQKAERRNEADKRESDPFLKYGLPAFEERYQPTDVYRDVFEKLASDYAARPYESKEKKYPPGQKPSSSKDLVAMQALKNASYRPYFPGESKAELDAIRKELKAKRVYDPNAEYRPYFPGESDADVRRIARERQAAKNTDQPTSDTGAKTGQSYAPGEKLRTGMFDAEKAKLAGNSPERMDRVAQALVALLQTRIDESGNTPLKDELTRRGIFAAAAAKPKASTAAAKNYTVKGSEVIGPGR